MQDSQLDVGTRAEAVDFPHRQAVAEHQQRSARHGGDHGADGRRLGEGLPVVGELLVDRLPGERFAAPDEVAKLRFRSASRCQSIRQRRQTEGICRAVRRCGQLIQEHFPIKADDTDELDNLIVED